MIGRREFITLLGGASLKIAVGPVDDDETDEAVRRRSLRSAGQCISQDS
jgi:hypothetical protein